MPDTLEQQRAELVQLLANFDWYYDRSDDFSYWSRMNGVRVHIETLAKQVPGGLALLEAARLKSSL